MDKITKGDQVRCIKTTTTGPMVDADDSTLYTVTRSNGPHFWTEEFPHSYFKTSEFEIVKLDIPTLTKMKEKATQRFNDEINAIDAKLQYIKETKVTAFDTTQFMVWSVLQELENATSDKMDKVEKITAIIKG